MSKISAECTYCGYKWLQEYYNEYLLLSLKCVKCNDKKLKLKNPSENKINTYDGSPPFKDDIDAENLDNIINELRR
jgi:DNA-directed RNA polymerase subunit RPC12/RpoP